MAKIVKSGDCGNSPKNALLERVSIAFALGDFESVESELVEDIQWSIVGSESVRGISQLGNAWERQRRKAVKRVVIRHVVNHGRSGAVEGELELSDGRHIAFCDFCDFGSAKGTTVGRVSTYLVAL